jgi:hypothetical protein
LGCRAEQDPAFVGSHLCLLGPIIGMIPLQNLADLLLWRGGRQCSGFCLEVNSRVLEPPFSITSAL